MKYKVIRPNTTIKVNEKSYTTGQVFDAKSEDVKSLLDNKYITGVKDGKSANS